MLVVSQPETPRPSPEVVHPRAPAPSAFRYSAVSTVAITTTPSSQQPDFTGAGVTDGNISSTSGARSTGQERQGWSGTGDCVPKRRQAAILGGALPSELSLKFKSVSGGRLGCLRTTSLTPYRLGGEQPSTPSKQEARRPLLVLQPLAPGRHFLAGRWVPCAVTSPGALCSGCRPSPKGCVC